MNSYLFASLSAESAANAGQGSIWSMLIPLIIIIPIFYFFIIRPQKKQERQINEMRNGLQVGDEITTIGGIIGKIVSIKEDTILLETGRDGVRIRIHNSAVKCVDVKAEDC